MKTALERVLAKWKEHVKHAGVRVTDTDALANQIDRPFLMDRRKAYMR
ncbi:hypothetical protein [Bordetella flabilis]|nr:hypothetical protein [Bordetella flabilis]